MAKFEEYLNESTLTWGDLSESITNKVDRFEKLFDAYSKADDAEDTKTASKYESQLITLDDEILAMIKKQDTPKPKEVRVEKVAEQEKPSVDKVIKESPQESPQESPKDDTKSDEEEDEGWNFGLLKW